MSSCHSRFITAQDVTSAWISGIRMLKKMPNFEAFNLAVRIDNPIAEDDRLRELIQSYLCLHHKRCGNDHINTVVETIFPHSYLYSTCSDPRVPEQRGAFYDKYRRNSGTIRAFNPKGTYFQRLINWPSWDTPRTRAINQIETIICKINSEKASRVVHEIGLDADSTELNLDAKLYDPLRDRKYAKIVGFPCLSHISIKPESAQSSGGKIHMAAIYRSHYFIEKAYGNYLGLGLLLKFIADATGREVGELFCVSSLAMIDYLSRKRVDDLLTLLKKAGAE